MIHNHRHQLLVSSASCYRVKKHSGLTKCYNAPVFHSAAHVRNCNQIWNIGRAIFLKLIGQTSGGSRRGARRGLSFRPNCGPKGRKKNFGHWSPPPPPPPSSQGLDPARQTAGLRWCNKLKSLDSQKVQEYLSCSQSNGLECCNFRAI